MQLRFKIDKKNKSGNQPQPTTEIKEIPSTKRNYIEFGILTFLDIPLRTSASTDTHPAIFVIGPVEDSVSNPISPRAKPTSPRDHIVRHTPYTQTGNFSKY